MPSNRSQARLYQELMDKYGRLVADAFLKALQSLTALAELQRVTAAIEAGDVEAALEALHIDPAAFDELQDRIREARTEAGRAAADHLPKKAPDGTVLAIRFGGNNREAVRQAEEQGSSLITRVTEDVRTVTRDTIGLGLRRGENPRQTALDLIGRVNRATGKRSGGLIGLTPQQAGFVDAARTELLSGDPALLKNYLSRGRRDRRFDRTVTKAIAEKKPIPKETVDRAITSYTNKMLALRGEVIGRTESLTAMNAAAYEAIRQAVASGKIPAAAVRRVWRSAGDFRVRHTHRSLNAESVGLDEAFRSPSGALMRFPGDTSLGAPASEIVSCRCIVANRVDWLANLR